MSSDAKGEAWDPLSEDYLTGEHPRTVADDGRIVLPRTWRGLYGTDCYLWLGERGEVRIYPEPFYRRLAREQSARHRGYESNPQAQRFFSQTTRLSVDTQGRLVLPKGTREKQGLGSQIVLFGYGTHFDVRPSEGRKPADKGGGGQE
jgi:DNA-binding transcriptional regulator/RsmH inhibitor MraZ